MRHLNVVLGLDSTHSANLIGFPRGSADPRNPDAVAAAAQWGRHVPQQRTCARDIHGPRLSAMTPSQRSCK
jgi:hypothetical protein